MANRACRRRGGSNAIGQLFGQGVDPLPERGVNSTRHHAFAPEVIERAAQVKSRPAALLGKIRRDRTKFPPSLRWRRAELSGKSNLREGTAKQALDRLGHPVGERNGLTETRRPVRLSFSTDKNEPADFGPMEC